MKRTIITVFVTIFVVILIELAALSLFNLKSPSPKQLITQIPTLSKIPAVHKESVGFNILCPFDDQNICMRAKQEDITTKNGRIYTINYYTVPEGTPILAVMDADYLLTSAVKLKLPHATSETIMQASDGFQPGFIFYLFQGDPATIFKSESKSIAAGETIGYVGKNRKLTILEVVSRGKSVKLIPSEDGKVLKPQEN